MQKYREGTHGDKISIEGGITTVGATIEVESLGSKNEAHTDIEVGINYVAHPSQMNTRKVVSDLKTSLKRLIKNSIHYIN